MDGNAVRWIGTFERLPGKDDQGEPLIVLVFCRRSLEPVWLGYCERNEEWYDVDGARLPAVEAWMPLPRPPWEGVTNE